MPTNTPQTTATSDSITITAVAEQEYRIGEDGSWQSGNAGQEVPLSNLQPGTQYNIYYRTKAVNTGSSDNKHFASFANSTTVTTLPAITTESLAAGYVGVAYNARLEAGVAEGKTVTWKLAEDSSLPAGLSLSENGTISGTPTTIGEFNFTVTASIDGAEGEGQVSNTEDLSITISAANADFGTLTVSNGDEVTDTFTYGDTITVSGKITAAAPNNGANALSEPAANQVGLYLNDTELATTNVESNGTFTLTYDTAQKGITPGSSAQNLTVKYGGDDGMNPGSETVGITLSPKPVTAQVQGTISKVYDGVTDANVTLGFADGAILSRDNVSVSAPNAAYASNGVGENISINLGELTVTGDHASFYAVSAPTNVTGTITAAASTLTVEPSSTSNRKCY